MEVIEVHLTRIIRNGRRHTLLEHNGKPVVNAAMYQREKRDFWKDWTKKIEDRRPNLFWWRP